MAERMTLTCPYCNESHAIPEDDKYGGEFTAPCGNVVEVEYDEYYDKFTDEECGWRRLLKGGANE